VARRARSRDKSRESCTPPTWSQGRTEAAGAAASARASRAARAQAGRAARAARTEQRSCGEVVAEVSRVGASARRAGRPPESRQKRVLDGDEGRRARMTAAAREKGCAGEVEPES
jgi:hypothetical protein